MLFAINEYEYSVDKQIISDVIKAGLSMLLKQNI